MQKKEGDKKNPAFLQTIQLFFFTREWKFVRKIKNINSMIMFLIKVVE